MSQQQLLDCPVCLETKEKKDFFPLKCCGNSLCKSCESDMREKNCHLLPNSNYRFICCPLCREMESVSFQVAQSISDTFRRNFQEFYINMAPGFHLTPEQQNQRNVREIHRLVDMQQQREILERENREQRIQQERYRLQQLELFQEEQARLQAGIQRRQREEEDRQYEANILSAMRLLNPMDLLRRRRDLIQRNMVDYEPVTPPGDPPGWIEPVQPQVPSTQIPTRQVPTRQVPTRQVPTRQVPSPHIPPPHIPAPSANRRTDENARRQPRIAAPLDEPNRTKPCFNENCHHTTVFRCQVHPSVVCCRTCVCPQCIP